jgi:ElaB/YqjD/DUF883 family membrane-anchored ribosome-binding protein
MTADAVVSRELKSLQEELSSSREKRFASVAASSASAALPPAAPVTDTDTDTDTPQERELRDQLGELADELTSFFGNAEKTIAAHPTESVMGALLAGILIGRLLGRR